MFQIFQWLSNLSITSTSRAIITLEPNILLGEACDIARYNLCNILIKSYKEWELKREKVPVRIENKLVTSYIIHYHTD